MNAQIFKGTWEKIKRKVKQKWSNLTDSNLFKVDGKYKKFIQFIILALALSGALNWGLISLLNLNMIVMSFGDNSFITRLVYLLISIASLYLLLHPDYRRRKRVQPTTHDVSNKQIIAKDSPLNNEQENFINEGGNSQPLRKESY